MSESGDVLVAVFGARRHPPRSETLALSQMARPFGVRRFGFDDRGMRQIGVEAAAPEIERDARRRFPRRGRVAARRSA